MLPGRKSWDVALSAAGIRAYPRARTAVSSFDGDALAGATGVDAQLLARTLDGVAAALFLVDAAGRILHANRSADRLVDERQVTRRENNRLTLADKHANQMLATALADATRRDGCAKQVFFFRGADGQSFIATVLPLAAEEQRSIGRAKAGAVAVWLRQPGLDTGIHRTGLAELYGLTPRETAILAASVEVGGVPKVAGALGLADSTIRTHLKSIFRKTGARRQSDLIRLVAAAADPFGRCI